MRQFLRSLRWGFLVVFVALTIMIIASWNSLPGDPLYGVKLGLEQALFVLVSPSYAAQGDLSVKYTQRRFSEAKRLLEDKGSVEGLRYLDKQITTTRDIIEKGSDTKTQTELAQKYIDTLTNISAQLTAQQQALASAQPAAGLPAQGTTPVAPVARGQSPQGIVPVQQPGTAGAPPVVTTPLAQVQPPPAASPQNPPSAPVVQQQTPPPPPPPPVVAPPPPPPVAVQQQINQTQANIQQTIQELKQVMQKAQQENRKSDKRRDGYKD